MVKKQANSYISIRTLNIGGKQSTYVKLNVASIRNLMTNYKKLDLVGEESDACKVKRVERIKNNIQEQNKELFQEYTSSKEEVGDLETMLETLDKNMTEMEVCNGCF